MTVVGSRSVSLRSAIWAALSCVIVGVVSSVAIQSALAEGDPDGSSPATIAFAGTLRQGGKGMPPETHLTFTFKKQQQAPTGDCPAVDIKVDPEPTTGSFEVEIPLGDCTALFDGAAVFFDVDVDSTRIVAGRRVLPVPYAEHAKAAGSAVGALDERIVVIEQRTVKNAGKGASPTLEFTIPQSTLGGTNRAALLTVKATGNNCVLVKTYLVLTGQQSGAAVFQQGAIDYNVGDIAVTSNLSAGVFSDDDVLKGITVTFSNMPASWEYVYTIAYVDGV